MGAIMLLLGSCMPQLRQPRNMAYARYTHYGDCSADSIPSNERWWEIFKDSTLNTLIEHALHRNPDIGIALSRIETARSQRKVTRAQYLPQFSLNVEGEGEYTEAAGIEQTYSLQPAVSWELSLFGAWKHSGEAAKAEILASFWAYRGTRLSLAAEVATTYFTLLEYERDLLIARRSAQLREESAALIDSMFRHGMTDGVALEQARSLLYTAQADISAYQRCVAQTRLSMNALLGESPAWNGLPEHECGLSTRINMTHIPVGIPSELLERRPDILQARYRMTAAAHRVGVAHAARFPAISITAKGGISYEFIKGTQQGKPFTWDVLAGILQPLFSFGKLKHNQQIAEQNYNQSVAAYEKCVINAFAEVEKALVAIETSRKEAEKYRQLVLSNERIATMSQALYRSGLSNFLEVIDAERSLYQSQMQLVNLVVKQYTDFIVLFQAVGGGYIPAEK